MPSDPLTRLLATLSIAVMGVREEPCFTLHKLPITRGVCFPLDLRYEEDTASPPDHVAWVYTLLERGGKGLSAWRLRSPGSPEDKDTSACRLTAEEQASTPLSCIPEAYASSITCLRGSTSASMILLGTEENQVIWLDVDTGAIQQCVELPGRPKALQFLETHTDVGGLVHLGSTEMSCVFKYACAGVHVYPLVRLDRMVNCLQGAHCL